MKTDSPCVNICRLDDQRICVGCLRSVEEIAAWSRMSEAEKAAVMAALSARRPKPETLCEVTSNE
jgi:predicted Fe-S protein YdhL (DUF1289 family)